MAAVTVLLFGSDGADVVCCYCLVPIMQSGSNFSATAA